MASHSRNSETDLADPATAAWRKSYELRVARGASVVWATVVYGWLVVAFLIATHRGGLERRQYLAIGVATVATVSLAAFGMAVAFFRRRFLEGFARKQADAAIEELSSTSNLTDLLKANRKQMSAYDLIVRYQAESSYRNSQIAMTIGFALLVAGAVVTITAQGTATKVATAALTGVSGVLAGYISRTYLSTYNTTLKQLNFYFEQPLINSYILVAQRLGNELGKNKKEEMIAAIIRGIVTELVRPSASATAAPVAPPVQANSKLRSLLDSVQGRNTSQS